MRDECCTGRCLCCTGFPCPVHDAEWIAENKEENRLSDAWKLEERYDWQREGGPVPDAGGVDPDDPLRDCAVCGGECVRKYGSNVVRQLPTPATQLDGSVLALAEVCDVRGLPNGEDEAGGATPATDSCQSCGFPSPKTGIRFPTDAVIGPDGGSSWSEIVWELVCDGCLGMFRTVVHP